MKRFLLSLLISLPLLAMAQPPEGKPGLPPPNEGRLKSLEIAYLTRELDITPAEAEKFWPVYNKYQEEMKTAHQSTKDDDVLERQQQMLNIRKKYKPEFSKLLSPERANKLYEAEGKFRDMVRKELQNRREMLEKKQDRRGG